MSVERFDFRTPPPGHHRVPGRQHLVTQGHGKPRLLAEAWARWRSKRDPPGMRVIGTGDRDQTFDGARFFFLSHTDTDENARRRVAARVAAWSAYDRRIALADALERTAKTVEALSSGAWRPEPFWPRCLLWTDAECDSIDHWRAHGGEMPPPLRA